MTINHHTDSTAAPTTAVGPDELRAEIARTRADLGDTVTALTNNVDPRVRVRQAATTAKLKAASGVAHVRTVAPQRARQAQQTVRANPVPVAAGVLAILAASAAVLVGRRRAAKAKAVRNRWRPGFLRR